MKAIIPLLVLLAFPVRPAVPQQATEPIRQAVMKSDLRNLVTAEEVYFADSVKYTADLKTIASFYKASPGVIGLHITLTTDGWTRSVGHEGTTTVCVIFVGSIPIPPATAELASTSAAVTLESPRRSGLVAGALRVSSPSQSG